MMKKIACLHAHYSNISYIEKALSFANCMHFVDPGLVHRVTTDPKFAAESAAAKIENQLKWMEECSADAILLTCTNYIALLPETFTSAVPVIKIDESYFRRICEIEESQLIVFTNPETVEGTMKRLYEFAYYQNIKIKVRPVVIEGAFELVMNGNLKEYKQKVKHVLHELMNEHDAVVSVAQLSMVEAAEEVSNCIITPLQPLAEDVRKVIIRS
jgi:aspartate/glutamate racemase